MLIYLKVKPNQRFNRVEKLNSEWQIRIKAPAVDGKANEHLVQFLSEILKIPKSKISLVKGKTSRNKCLEINEPEETVLRKFESSINRSM